MTISRSCQCGLSIPVMLWTTIFLILLARGVSSISDEQSRFGRSPKYEQDADVQGGLVTSSMQEIYNVIQVLRELLQRQQQRANQQLQVYNKGEDLSDNQIDWRKVPLPLLYQIRSIINEGSKEEDKRGSCKRTYTIPFVVNYFNHRCTQENIRELNPFEILKAEQLFQIDFQPQETGLP